MFVYLQLRSLYCLQKGATLMHLAEQSQYTTDLFSRIYTHWSADITMIFFQISLTSGIICHSTFSLLSIS